MMAISPMSIPARFSARLVRPLLFCALAGMLSLLLAAPANAVASQAFHYGPDEKLALAPGADLREPLSSGVSACAASACAQHTEVHAHRYTFENAGNGRPVHSDVWVDVTQATAGSNDCSLELYAELLAPNGNSKWYWDYCPGLDVLGMGATPGLYEISVDWPADYNSKAVEPGDHLYTAVWTASNSLPEAPTAFLVSDAAHPSTLTFSGIDEPVPASLNQTTETTTATATSTATSSTTTSATTTHGTTTSKPPATTSTTSRTVEPAPTSTTDNAVTTPSKASPVPGILIGVGLLGAARSARRRLA